MVSKEKRILDAMSVNLVHSTVEIAMKVRMGFSDVRVVLLALADKGLVKRRMRYGDSFWIKIKQEELKLWESIDDIILDSMTKGVKYTVAELTQSITNSTWDGVNNALLRLAKRKLVNGVYRFASEGGAEYCWWKAENPTDVTVDIAKKNHDHVFNAMEPGITYNTWDVARRARINNPTYVGKILKKLNDKGKIRSSRLRPDGPIYWLRPLMPTTNHSRVKTPDLGKIYNPTPKIIHMDEFIGYNKEKERDMRPEEKIRIKLLDKSIDLVKEINKNVASYWEYLPGLEHNKTILNKYAGIEIKILDFQLCEYVSRKMFRKPVTQKDIHGLSIEQLKSLAKVTKWMRNKINSLLSSSSPWEFQSDTLRRPDHEDRNMVLVILGVIGTMIAICLIVIYFAQIPIVG